MWIWITFCAVLQLANGEKFAKVLKTEAQNSIIFEKVGTLWSNVKYGYLRFEIDMNPMYQNIEKCKHEFEQIEHNFTEDKSIVEFIKTDLESLAIKMKKAKNLEKKVKDFGEDIPENSVVVNVPKSKPRDRIILSEEPIIVLGMKILDNRFKIDDFLSMIETYVDWQCQVVPTFFSRFDHTFDVEAGISELLEHFPNYQIKSQDGFSFRYIEIGKIEIIQKVTLIDTEQIFDWYERLSIPLVYKNEVLIDLDTKREFAVQEDKKQFAIIPKDFHVYCKYEHVGRFCTESLQIMDQSQFEKTCYGTLYFQKFGNIKENCNFQFNTPEIFAKRSGNYEQLVFHPDPEKAQIECNEKQVDDWEKTIDLHKFQKLQIPGSCTVHTSQFVLLGRQQDIFKVNEKEFTNHILSNTDLEKIWPELKNKKVREMIHEEKSTQGNMKIVQTTSNVTINLGINLREEL